MKDFFLKHKILLICIVLAIIGSAVYLHAALRPGYWLWDTFLYQQQDGSFHGSNQRGDYTMQIQRSGSSTTITMRINEITHVYEICQTNANLQILRDGEAFFTGTVQNSGGVNLLLNSDGSIAEGNFDVYASGAYYTTEELFPSIGWLYGSVQPKGMDTRGNPWMLALAWFLAVFLIVDICFPDLFFRIKFWGIVEGGEPGERYRFGQYLGRFLIPVAILIILLMGFDRP